MEGTELISIYRGNKPGDWPVALLYPLSRVESWGMNFIVQLSDPTLSRPVYSDTYFTGLHFPKNYDE